MLREESDDLLVVVLLASTLGQPAVVDAAGVVVYVAGVVLRVEEKDVVVLKAKEGQEFLLVVR